MPGTYISPAETGFYYLKTRYYDPEVSRFLNADVFVSTGQGILGNNMFAYCLNNPVNMFDYVGMYSFKNKVNRILLSILFGSYVATNVPSKEKHYARNDNQSDITNDVNQIIGSDEWERQPDRKNRYHRHPNTQGNDAKYNVKYMTKDNRKEVIINFSDTSNPKIVDDEYNMGTYNYGTDYITHFLRDMLPYWMWGNSPVDSGIDHAWNRVKGVD